MYQSHEIANIFPKMSGEELKDLTADIKKNGLLEPIVLFQDKILDGRNRYSACIAADIKAEFVEYDGDDPIQYVLSLNLFRRHLDAGQRALVASNMAQLPAYRPVENKCLNSGTSQAQAASLLNVSRDSVQKAKKVQENAIPEVVEKLRDGEISLNAASKVSKLPEAEQKTIVKKGNEAIKEAAAKPSKPDIKKETVNMPSNEETLLFEIKELRQTEAELRKRITELEERNKELEERNKELESIFLSNDQLTAALNEAQSWHNKFNNQMLILNDIQIDLNEHKKSHNYWKKEAGKLKYELDAIKRNKI
jgi:ParB-like chromosome segregation protein Spo0J